MGGMSSRSRRWMCICVLLALRSPGLSAQKAPNPANPVVVLQTNVGDITIELFKDAAPRTVENFLGYVNSGFYAGTIFHRVIPDFMIQGGGFTPQMRQKPTRPPIKNEASISLRNERGTVAAARLATVDSATAQFFINTSQNSSLDHKSIRPDEYGYAVFGRVIDGMDVVDKIGRVKTDGKDVPRSLIMITRVYVKETP
jgi:cyclophilin family peptidyl-prolyl cis-trans isomerase